MNMDQEIDAELLRQSHCDRKDQKHKCIGEMTIDRTGMSLSCQLCGVDREYLERIGPLVETAKTILGAAGINFEDLDASKKKAVLREVLVINDRF